MLNLNFFEDEDYNFLQFCLNYNNFTSSFNKVQLFFKNCGLKSLKLIKGGRNNQFFYSDKMLSSTSLSSVKNKVKDNLYQEIMKKITQTKEYKRYLVEREDYLVKVKKIWQENYNKIDEYLKKVLKKDYQKININLYISNPHCNTGQTFFGDNLAVFGHEKGIMQNDPNYELVYIVHESMHLLYPYKKYCGNSLEDYPYAIVHLIIELVTDYNFAIELRGENYRGHDYLDEYKNFLLPKFIEYLNGDKYESLSEFINEMIIEYENSFSKNRK